MTYIQPELLSGTLRQNLDPFEQNDHATLYEALRAAGLFALQDEDDEAHINLDTNISGGGANLSVGQRQILALARAMIRRSKLVILDEGRSIRLHSTTRLTILGICSYFRNWYGLSFSMLDPLNRISRLQDGRCYQRHIATPNWIRRDCDHHRTSFTDNLGC